MLPFIGALVVSFSPQRRAPNGGFVRRTDHAVHVVADLAFYQADKVAVTLTLVNVGDVHCLAWSLIA